MSRGPLKFKETDVRRFLRAFTKEGLRVDKVMVDSDGNLTAIPALVIPGEDGSNCSTEENEWDQKYGQPPA